MCVCVCAVCVCVVSVYSECVDINTYIGMCVLCVVACMCVSQ